MRQILWNPGKPWLLRQNILSHENLPPLIFWLYWWQLLFFFGGGCMSRSCWSSAFGREDPTMNRLGITVEGSEIFNVKVFLFWALQRLFIRLNCNTKSSLFKALFTSTYAFLIEALLLLLNHYISGRTHIISLLLRWTQNIINEFCNAVFVCETVALVWDHKEDFVW